MTPEESLVELRVVLEQLRRLLPTDKAGWDRDLVVRLAAERLWISAGNLAEAYRIARGIGPGVEPWAELAGYRHLLAHAVPGDVSSDRVFADTTADLPRIIEAVENT